MSIELYHQSQESYLNKLKSDPEFTTKVLGYQSKSKRNIFHVMAWNQDLVEARSIIGDMSQTLWDIMLHLLRHCVSINGEKKLRSMLGRQEVEEGHTPLHECFQGGNLEFAVGLANCLKVVLPTQSGIIMNDLLNIYNEVS